MAIWAKANKELAMKQGWDPNRDYNAPPAVTRNFGPVADGAEYGANLNQVSGIGPVASGMQYGQNLDAMAGTSGMGPLADEQAYGAMLRGSRRMQPRTSLAPGEANVAVFDPTGGEAPDPRKEQAAMLNREVIDRLKTSAGYTPREYEYGGPLEQEDQFRSQYPWTFS